MSAPDAGRSTCKGDHGGGPIEQVFIYLQSHTQNVLESHLMSQIVASLEDCLKRFGVPPPYPEADQILLGLASIILTLVMYYLLFGKRHLRRRQMLAKSLKEARDRVRALEDKLLELELLEQKRSSEDGEGGGTRKKPVRIWMDGCFDMMHYGHMNAFRQGKALGTHLVVGVNSDETIIACKGPPVMNDQERLVSVEGCRFVDEVVTGVPYVMSEEYLKYVIEKYRIDYVVHGDDPCIVNGKDVYEMPKKMGKYLSIPRTEGVSTTDIVGRMLLMSTSHHQPTPRHNDNGKDELDSSTQKLASLGTEGLFYRRSQFLTTSRMIRLFSVGMKAPPEGAKIIYIPGSWDMFHAGHVTILKRVKEQLGGYVIVGVHNDQVVNLQRGSNHPIMNLHERVLSVLGCKYVDDVLIDAPKIITPEMIASLKISVVVHGKHRDDVVPPGHHDPAWGEEPGQDPYEVPKKMGMYHEVTSESALSVRDIMARLQKNQQQFIAKFAKKKKVEDEYYAERYQLPVGNNGNSSTNNHRPGDNHNPAVTS